jgi:hypothetical protein
MEWRKKNTFGTTAFVSWAPLAVAGRARGHAEARLERRPVADLEGRVPHPVGDLHRRVMFVGTFRLNRALQVVFGTLAALFFILAIGDLTGITAITRIGGVEGIICGLSAVYAGLAQVLDEVYGRTLLPLGPVVHEPAARRRPVVRPAAQNRNDPPSATTRTERVSVSGRPWLCCVPVPWLNAQPRLMVKRSPS